MIADMKIDGKLEIRLKDPETKAITTKIIYATKIVSNEKEYWKYVQNNGRRLIRESPLRPILMGEIIAKEYLRRGISGTIHCYKCADHTQ